MAVFVHSGATSATRLASSLSPAASSWKQGTIFRSNYVYLGRRKYHWSLNLSEHLEEGAGSSRHI